MTSPFDPPSGSNPPYQGAPPPGYQASSSMPNTGRARAGFGARFGAWLLDSLLSGLLATTLGKTGQTWGRKIVGLQVVGEMTGEPIGFGKALGRVLFAGAISRADLLPRLPLDLLGQQTADLARQGRWFHRRAHLTPS